MDKFVLFAFLLFTANKSNSSVRFLGDSTACQSAFQNQMTHSLTVCVWPPDEFEDMDQNCKVKKKRSEFLEDFWQNLTQCAALKAATKTQ